jgi:peptidoglycan/xylan/chitin deacetylase (PgdA/CDA1 family)
MNDNQLFVSVDMDEWYLARWATGSQHSFWPDLPTLFQEVYQQTRPVGEIFEPTEQILTLFDDLKFKGTFFFTGLIASYYPELVKLIAGHGHEIGCHNFHHLDYENLSQKQFRHDLFLSKSLLEDLSGQPIFGYRSPNSSIPSFLIEELENAGFLYDSSVTPTRRIMGKFGNFTKAPLKPYRPSYQNLGEEGNSRILELPWAVFPGLKLPAGSGIMHRIMGNKYNNYATLHSLRKGSVSYYFHPYEISENRYLNLQSMPLKVRVFMLRTGKPYFYSLKNFLIKHKEKLTNGIKLYQKTIIESFEKI